MQASWCPETLSLLYVPRTQARQLLQACNFIDWQQGIHTDVGQRTPAGGSSLAGAIIIAELPGRGLVARLVQDYTAEQGGCTLLLGDGCTATLAQLHDVPWSGLDRALQRDLACELAWRARQGLQAPMERLEVGLLHAWFTVRRL
jgi:hypothetical protein